MMLAQCGVLIGVFRGIREAGELRLVVVFPVLFGLEIAFLVPWSVIFKDIVASESMRMFGFIEMMIFIGILAIGYVYAWAKGALDWE